MHGAQGCCNFICGISRSKAVVGLVTKDLADTKQAQALILDALQYAMAKLDTIIEY